jgi:hypothetical protein
VYVVCGLFHASLGLGECKVTLGTFLFANNSI